MWPKQSPDHQGEGKLSPLPNYECIDMGADSISIVKINSGKYKGFQYRYGKVGFDEDQNGNPNLYFTTEIISKPFWKRTPKENDLYFTQVTGDILVDLLKKNANSINTILVA